jgi:2-isopropylmalate synthase
MSTDLRDGNQALFEPMNPEKKMRFFAMLCAIGFKEIEIAFPAASDTDFSLTRSLIENRLVPDDVTLQVLTQARSDLITRTFAAIRGAKSVITHLYTATSPVFRKQVFRISKNELIRMTLAAVRQMKEEADKIPETQVTLEYSPEHFTTTELPFALEICDAVTEAWDTGADRPVILNLPATVEASTPNIYADQIEWMHTRIARRDSVILSLHTHNDRGTAIAAAELGLLAGGERVEGCLFGNGERTGNADLLTLALNLHTQGIDPELDFSDLPHIARLYEECTGLSIPPRHPYAGDLVFTAFSGSHQDAIKKGLGARASNDMSASAFWEVPYLPIDPADVGRGYDALIRVNSQSGKGGVAFLMEQAHGLVLPRRLQIEFSGVAQRYADATGGEITAETLWWLFEKNYLGDNNDRLRYREHALAESGEILTLSVEWAGYARVLSGTGNGPIDAAKAALSAFGLSARILSFEERAMTTGAESKARAVAFMEIGVDGQKGVHYGVGIDENIVTASIKALIGGVNRCLREKS